jgi:hypothetical protein
MSAIQHSTPEHWEVVVSTTDSTPVSLISRIYRVIAPSRKAAVDHVLGLDGSVKLLGTKHVPAWSQTFEVVEGEA